MEIEKALLFDLKGDYAHFKRYYTTTSPLTYSIPPKTSLYGLIGAILGLSKERDDEDYYLNFFQNNKCKIAIEIMKPIRKTRINLNLIDTKTAKMMSRIKNRTQIRTEFVVDPHYRIYFYHENEQIYEKLKFSLEKHKSHFTISLGLSENLANYEFIGEEKIENVSENTEFVEIATVLNVDDNLVKKNVDFTVSGREYFTEKVAKEMKSDREVTKYANLLYEKNGYNIKAKVKAYSEVASKKIIFL